MNYIISRLKNKGLTQRKPKLTDQHNSPIKLVKKKHNAKEIKCRGISCGKSMKNTSNYQI